MIRSSLGFLLGVALLADPATAEHKAFFELQLPSGLTASAVDSAGDVYIAGWTTEDVIPVTPNAFQKTFAQATCMDMPTPHRCPHSFVAKISSDGTRLIYATYLGGNGEDRVGALAVDSSGNAYVAGATSSTNFPVTPGAYQTSAGDSFLTKLNADGSAVLSSTYLTGAGASAIALDSIGNVYLAGGTTAATFPVTPGAFQRTRFPDFPDAFVLKLDPSLKTLLYATLLGGSDSDFAQSIAVDAQGSAYITGGTASTMRAAPPEAPPGYTPFPVTTGAYRHESFSTDVFVAKLNAEGTGLIYSAVFGGMAGDFGRDIAIDSAGNAYVGGASSLYFPLAGGAIQTGQSGGFAAKLSADGSRLVYSAFTGVGRAYDPLYAVAVSSSGSLLLAGLVDSGDVVRTTPDSLHPCFDYSAPGSRGFVLALNSDATGQIYSGYLDRVVALAADGNVWAPSRDQGRFLDRININVPLPPQITCVANAASLLSGPVAPGELVAIFGSCIGPEQPETLRLDASGKVDVYLGRLSVYFNGVAAPLLYVSKSQINAVVPFEVAGYPDTSVAILKEGVLLPQVYIPVAPSAPAVFTIDGTPLTPAILNEDATLNSPTNPARLGSFISIWATGAGLMHPLPETGAIGQGRTSIQLPVTVILQDPVFHGQPRYPVPLQVLYAGDAPMLVQGVIQVNVRLPEQLSLPNPKLVVTISENSSMPVATSVKRP